MTSKTAITVLILFAFSACRPGTQESIIKSAEQNAHKDSVKRNAEQKLDLELRLAIADSVSKVENRIAAVKKEIGRFKSEYLVQTDKLGKIKKFKLLRNKEEREKQIRAQSDVLYKLERQISELEYQLVNLQVRLDYFNSEMQRSSEN